MTLQTQLKLAQLPYVSPITLNDYPSYRRFFARDLEKLVYGNAWTYIIQACRGLGLGFKYLTEDALYSIGSHRGHYVIVRPLGTLDENFIDLLEALKDVSGKPVFIKKLFPEQAQCLLEQAKFVSSKEYAWDETAFADDDTYPEMIYDLRLTIGQETEIAAWCQLAQSLSSVYPLDRMKYYFRHIRGEIRAFHRQYQLSITDYQPELASQLLDFICDYFGIERESHVVAYHNILHYIPHDPENLFYYLAYMNEELVGFWVGERLNNHSLSNVVRVVHTLPHGLGDTMNFEIALKLQAQGIQWVNRGGSELEGLHIYKKRQMPIAQRTMPMLVYQPKISD